MKVIGPLPVIRRSDALIVALLRGDLDAHGDLSGTVLSRTEDLLDIHAGGRVLRFEACAERDLHMAPRIELVASEGGILRRMGRLVISWDI